MELLEVKELAVAIVLGFMIGLQRELSFHRHDRDVFMGARSISIISLIGYLSTKLYQLYPLVLIIISITIGSFLVAFYIIRAIKNKYNKGNTTELSALVAFILGLLVTDHLELAVFSAVILIALLEVKPKIMSIKEEIKSKDVKSAILFALMTFVVLPVLPDKTIDPYGLINPTHIWMMVILISGLSFIGYISTRLIDTSKGLIMMGLFGGLASSTATTLTLSKKATHNKEATKSLAIAIALACSTMFLRVVIWTFIFSREIFQVVVFPYILATLTGYALIYFLYTKTDKQIVSEEIVFSNPLEFSEALKMGVIFGVIFGALSLINNYSGDIGVYLASFLSGLSDVDAIVLSLSELFRNEEIVATTATIGIILASIANTVTKIAISFVVGSRSLGMYLSYIFSISLAVLLVSSYLFKP
ncbi:MAG: MgtC/SapB family protein [Campylobacterales bacterium]